MEGWMTGSEATSPRKSKIAIDMTNVIVLHDIVQWDVSRPAPI